ncbi:hypothetical protein [Streptomyces tsukubensis]|uniref:Integral membrane protein n=1 Tax=Streptomyces tsukubensis TaxID=83656 RepID=A0A1V4A6Q2_9ACTN|nr:hypothetical protein [Streptomyces tsukubensis]OON77722.1 hypothetical protein B1H18_17895 [Streptomyces tsukubensis]QFR93115.1 hypothetical protein GBW32_08525 [Streptomyces tsukubensis]
MDISGTQLRALRAALFTALVVTLSAASHVALSRTPLPPFTVAAVAGGVFVLSYALAGRERRYGRIAALLIPLELAADTVFTTGQHFCYGRAGGPVTGPLRSVGLDVLCDGGPVGTPLAGLAGGAETTHAATLLTDPRPGVAWLLLAAHVAVGLLAAAWLRRGERALAQALGALSGFAFRPLLVAVAAVTAVREPLLRFTGSPRTAPAVPVRLVAHSVGRRGPPCSVSALVRSV